MFDKTDQIFLAKMNGWIFKTGNDAAWSGKNISLADWKKLRPADLSSTYVDKDGRVECWFRIKIRTDDSIKNKQLGIKMSTWAASDLYIDDSLIVSFGNTGINGKPFKELSPIGHLSVPVHLEPGIEHIIAIHLVDFLSPVPPRRIKSADAGLDYLIRITGPAYNGFYLQKVVKEGTLYNTIWITVSTVLALLFWLIYFLNPFDKNLRLIAIGTSCIAICMYCQNAYQNTVGLSYTGFLIYLFLANIFIALSVIMIPLILIHIFGRNVSSGVKIFLIVFFIGFVTTGFANDSPAVSLFILSSLAVLFAICVYYMGTSWKNLKGAQWAIVAGLLFSLSWGIVFGIIQVFNINNTTAFYLSVTGYALSFPLSLLVYVAIRFKEIIKEVRLHAQQVMQLSEEIKEQAIQQQKSLQVEVERQTAELRTTLTNLKSTQAQLIQSEKMASLGELTAGIAHEIQNPLNFVNNFSELNDELIDEMNAEIEKGELSEARRISTDIKSNLEKISQHGKRADAIVKSMLQHSRTSNQTKEPTHINTITDEYLRLAYHGFRAKDSSFGATMKTSYDESIGTINIISQDIGRVILNLITNAFYSVNEKKKSGAGHYEPIVSVITKKLKDHIEISVADNGNGISAKLLDKIFQPFFTTKPTGQGTGLGLSLSYDIVRAQGGELKVESKEGEGAEFIIQLRLNDL